MNHISAVAQCARERSELAQCFVPTDDACVDGSGESEAGDIRPGSPTSQGFSAPHAGGPAALLGPVPKGALLFLPAGSIARGRCPRDGSARSSFHQGVVADDVAGVSMWMLLAFAIAQTPTDAVVPPPPPAPIEAAASTATSPPSAAIAEVPARPAVTPSSATPDTPAPGSIQYKDDTAAIVISLVAANAISYVGLVAVGVVAAAVVPFGGVLFLALPVIGVPATVLATAYLMSDSLGEFGAVSTGALVGHYGGLVAGVTTGALVGGAGLLGVALSNGLGTDPFFGGVALVSALILGAGGGGLVGGLVGGTAGTAIGASLGHNAWQE